MISDVFSDSLGCPERKYVFNLVVHARVDVIQPLLQGSQETGF